MYGLARVDRSGRVADRTVTGALGWRGGDQLTLTAEAGMVVIRRDSSGLVTIISQRHNRHVTSDCLGQPAPSRNVTGRLKNGRGEIRRSVVCPERGVRRCRRSPARTVLCQ